MSENKGKDEGALPTLDAQEQVLGAPVARVKSKTNVGRFMILAVVLGGFLFIIVGLLFWQKHKKNAAEAQPIVAAQPATTNTPGFATRNAPVEDAGIDKAKAEIKKQEAEEERRMKELEAAQAAAEAEAQAQEAKKGKGKGLQGKQMPPPQQQPQYGAADAQGQGGGAPAAPPPPKSGVLLDLTGAKPKKGESQPASEKDQRERIQADYAARMAAVTGQNGAGAARPAAAQGGPSGGEGLGGRLQGTVLAPRIAGKLPNLDYLLKRGTSIPCALQTGIDTTLPGFVMCKVLNDVYSANHKVLLVERGATVFGEQQTGLKQGQSRTFVLWTRIDNPSGVFADIDSPATDQMGYSGIPGYVDTHFWSRFGGAIMLSLIRDYSSALSQKTTGTTQTGATYNNTQQATQDMAAEALRNSINIPPTLTVLPGTVVNVMVARDVSFENVYSLVE